MRSLPSRLLQELPATSADSPEFWRSMEELADRPAFQAALRDEFPIGASLWSSGPTGRRAFLRLMGASLALAGLCGCTKRSREKILPYARQPELLVPGRPLMYATAMAWEGFARGILVESHMGRPTKIEGNPDHPDSLGAADAVTQAAILDLYDPDRLKIPYRHHTPSTWQHFRKEWIHQVENARSGDGDGLGVLFEPVASPTLLRQLEALRSAFPRLRVYAHDPLENPVSNSPLRPSYRIENADTILAVGSDFLTDLPESLRYARAFAHRRRVVGKQDATMSRLYVGESRLSLTGAKADHRAILAPDELVDLLRRLLHHLSNRANPPIADEPASAFIAAAADDLRQSGRRSLVVVGPRMPLAAHQLAQEINVQLGNLGETLVYLPNPRRSLDGLGDLGALARDARSGALKSLVILSGNPAYTAAPELEIPGAIETIPWTAHLGTETNETNALCRWSLPEAHFLETWGDLHATDGTATIQQPLIDPLYQGRSVHELLHLLQLQPTTSARALIQDTWRERFADEEFKMRWETSLRDGVVAGTSFEPITPEANPYSSAADSVYPQTNDNRLWALFRPDTRVGDGRHFRNAWLQELPADMTRIVWDNAAHIAPATAASFGLAVGDVVRLTLHGRSVEAPVWIDPGHAPNCVTLPLGYGRVFDIKDGSIIGFNAYSIRTNEYPWDAYGLEMLKLGRNYPLVTTQDHHSMHGRHLAMKGTLSEFRANPNFVHDTLSEHAPKPGETMYPSWPDGSYAWGMAIDLGACIGCQACVVACQAENNIPVVGKAQVAVGREMHWIRVDRYYHGNVDTPEALHQPVPCMHCENAPCEVVCPVAATVHGNSGLNEMVYNRCVGTRYCSNNCPYKVRRFNFLDYRGMLGRDDSTRALQNNPDVTVRMRGVMEKCTYCTQRISAVRIEAKKANRPIRDGEIVPACAQTCPVEAIQFGNIADPSSDVAKLKRSPLNYGLLDELNTRPRTTYLAQISNRNDTT